MQLSNAVLLALSVGASCAASVQAPERPSVAFHPKQPYKALPASPKRDPLKVCVVPRICGDASPAILSAAKECNNGGTVVFPAGGKWKIASKLDLTFLKSIDFAILGTIVFKDDVYGWQDGFFAYTYQTAHLMWRFGGEDVNIYGLGQGVIDGVGQTWWTAASINSSVIRPILFGTDGLHGGSITGLNMKNPPNWFNLIANSSDIVISDMNLNVVQLNATYPAKNTDGWDTFRSDNIVIQDSVINNTDDCVSFKPNSTQVLIQNLRCNGSHGISVGSLGQYQGEIDIIENIYVYNISISNASDSARIKVWPGVAPNVTGSTSGGGSGRVYNVTYEGMNISNNDNAISLTQCYFAASQAACDQYPSDVIIENVLFKDFAGVTSKKYDPKLGSLVCSGPTVCKNVQAHNITVVPPSGKAGSYTCTNLDKTLLDITCM
ncbi:polygalacturonase [Thozetella sp. PMI_491]|nr:polygalacturonase [Thozetella sp. PMI_491]